MSKAQFQCLGMCLEHYKQKIMSYVYNPDNDDDEEEVLLMQDHRSVQVILGREVVVATPPNSPAGGDLFNPESPAGNSEDERDNDGDAAPLLPPNSPNNSEDGGGDDDSNVDNHHNDHIFDDINPQLENEEENVDGNGVPAANNNLNVQGPNVEGEEEQDDPWDVLDIDKRDANEVIAPLRIGDTLKIPRDLSRDDPFFHHRRLIGLMTTNNVNRPAKNNNAMRIGRLLSVAGIIITLLYASVLVLCQEGTSYGATVKPYASSAKEVLEGLSSSSRSTASNVLDGIYALVNKKNNSPSSNTNLIRIHFFEDEGVGSTINKMSGIISEARILMDIAGIMRSLLDSIIMNSSSIINRIPSFSIPTFIIDRDLLEGKRSLAGFIGKVSSYFNNDMVPWGKNRTELIDVNHQPSPLLCYPPGNWTTPVVFHEYPQSSWHFAEAVVLPLFDSLIQESDVEPLSRDVSTTEANEQVPSIPAIEHAGIEIEKEDKTGLVVPNSTNKRNRTWTNMPPWIITASAIPWVLLFSISYFIKEMMNYQAATKIQAAYRAYTARMNYLHTTKDIITVQASVRRRLARNELGRRNRAATSIQKIFRRVILDNTITEEGEENKENIHKGGNKPITPGKALGEFFGYY